MVIKIKFDSEEELKGFSEFAIALTGAVVGGQLVTMTDVRPDPDDPSKFVGRIETQPGTNVLAGGKWLYHELPNPRSFRPAPITPIAD